MTSIVRYPNYGLRCPALPVGVFGDNLRETVLGLHGVLERDPSGIALAANQGGRREAIFVVRPGVPGMRGCYVNPRVTPLGPDVVLEEGCLSIPGLTLRIPRASRVSLEAQGIDGTTFTEELTGLAAQIAQHECDHLVGRVILDHVGKRSKSRLLERLFKRR